MVSRNACSASQHFSSFPLHMAYVARKRRRMKILAIEATHSCDVEVGQSKSDDGIDMENIISSARIWREIVREYFTRMVPNLSLALSLSLFLFTQRWIHIL